LGDGENRLWVLFGDADGYGRLDDGMGYVLLAAPLRTWSKHIIRPGEFYDLFGWQPPSYSPRSRNGLAFQAPQLQLSLLIASRSLGESCGVFGPIEQEQTLVDPKVFVAEALAHPDEYYVTLGDAYRRQRNYDLALDAYSRALDYHPSISEGYFGLAEARFWLDDWAEALGAFEKAFEFGYPRTEFLHRGMAWSYYNLGDYAQAESRFLQAVQEDSFFADAYNGLGWVLLKQQHCDRATELFERAQALAPDFPDPQRGIEECTRWQ
jgi:tetratricopeptide (TPR) repeat protein